MNLAAGAAARASLESGAAGHDGSTAGGGGLAEFDLDGRNEASCSFARKLGAQRGYVEALGIRVKENEFGGWGGGAGFVRLWGCRNRLGTLAEWTVDGR